MNGDRASHDLPCEFVELEGSQRDKMITYRMSSAIK